VVTTEPVTIEQAAAILGVSASTIRRRIRAGTLQVTETRRPQGVVWLVHLPPGVRPATATDTVDTPPVDTAPTTQPAPADAMVSLIQTTIGTVLGPLVSELAASRQTIERQAETIADLREERGRLSAELAAERQAKASTDGPTAPQPVTLPLEPSTPRWRSWWPWLLIVAFLVVAWVLLGWPR
jgi:excisionase family DNA binding protein